MRSVVWFAEVGVADVETVGGKGANLGELTGAGLPVPPGFVITSEAYLDAIERTGTRAKLGEILEGLDPRDMGNLAEVAEQAEALV
ncbi:MAG TPA: PEP/pyruvate-binding domain-containing protein, partial [Acidimicrobiales bacterium]